MKILRPIAVLLVLAAGGSGWGQGNLGLAHVPSLRFENADVHEVLHKYFGSQRFPYGATLDLPTRITLNGDNLPFEAVLARILEAADATSSIEGGVIYLRSRPMSVNVDFEEVDVNRALSEAARKAKRPLRVIPKLQGKVSLRLRRAQLSTVLAAIAGPHGAGVGLENGVYVVDSKTPVPDRLPAIPHDTVLFVESPVTLRANDEDVRKVLRRLFELRNLDFIIDPRVQGRVTIDLEKTPFRDAMRRILEPLGARMQRTMHVIEIKKSVGK